MVSLQTVRIQQNRMQALQEILEKQLADDGRKFHDCLWHEKKEICCKLAMMPKDAKRIYTVTWYLKQAGIPRTTYYEILGNDTYGSFQQKKDMQDQQDIETIKEVIAYKGFAKGARQIYMDMPDITGRHFALKKIYRLMHKYRTAIYLQLRSQIIYR